MKTGETGKPEAAIEVDFADQADKVNKLSLPNYLSRRYTAVQQSIRDGFEVLPEMSVTHLYDAPA